VPVYWTKPHHADAKSHETVQKYRLPYGFDGEAAADRMASLRIRFMRERDEMLTLQKTAAKSGDRETARFFSDEAKDRLKLYRAVCLALPWVAGDAPGDCLLKDPYDFPIELAGALDFVCGLAA